MQAGRRGRHVAWGMGLLLALGVGPAAPSSAEEVCPDSWLDDAALHAVSFVSSQVGWAVGDRGVIWHTTDGGKHWRRQDGPAEGRLNDVFFLDSRHGWIVGAEYTPRLGIARAVVLSTRDGGAHWERLPQLLLPALRRCGFHDRLRGWAIGEPSPGHPAGVFTTDDGGRSWKSISGAATTGWTTAWLRPDGSGWLANELGAVGQVDGQSLRMLSLPLSVSTLIPVGQALLLGTARDGILGSDWRLRGLQPVPTPLGRAAGLVDWRASAVAGEEVWLAGDPGSVVLHLKAGESQWRAHETGSPLPIQDLAFVDRQTGFAVGALGQILKTADGGQHWQPVRATSEGPRRLGVLGVFLTLEDIPLEWLIRQAAVERWRVGVVVIGHPSGEGFRETSERLGEGLVRAGCALGWIDPQVALPPSGIRVPWERMLQVGEAEGAADEFQQVVQRLATTIAIFRPDRVVVGSGRGASDPLLESAVRRAAQMAGEPGPLSDAFRALALAPWEVDRVDRYAIEPSGEAPVESTELVADLGTTVGQLADEVRSRLTVPPAPPHGGQIVPLSGEPARFIVEPIGATHLSSPSSEPMGATHLSRSSADARPPNGATHLSRPNGATHLLPRATDRGARPHVPAAGGRVGGTVPGGTDLADPSSGVAEPMGVTHLLPSSSLGASPQSPLADPPPPNGATHRLSPAAGQMAGGTDLAAGEMVGGTVLAGMADQTPNIAGLHPPVVGARPRGLQSGGSARALGQPHKVGGTDVTGRRKVSGTDSLDVVGRKVGGTDSLVGDTDLVGRPKGGEPPAGPTVRQPAGAPGPDRGATAPPTGEASRPNQTAETATGPGRPGPGRPIGISAAGIPPTTDARRPGSARRAASEPRGDLQDLAARARQQALIDAIVQQGARSPSRLDQVAQLTYGLAPDAASRLLLTVGMAQARGGQVAAAADTLASLLRAYPDQPPSWPAVEWLLGYYGSAEFALRSSPNPPPASFEHWKMLVELAKAHWPEPASLPRHRLLLAAGWRRERQAEEAQRQYRLISTLGGVDLPWRRAARAELALDQPAADGPLPALAIPYVPRPRLDGDLTDATWQGAARMTLEPGPRELPVSPAQLLVARDSQFLFLAAICPHAPGEAGAGPPPAQRDPVDDSADRLRLVIDVDRDFQTYWLLEIGAGGSVTDALNDDRSWNPQWYVATDWTDDHWTVEAAIPLSSLSPTPDAPGAWCVRAARIVPGTALPSWPPGGSIHPSPLGGGYWIFENAAP